MPTINQNLRLLQGLIAGDTAFTGPFFVTLDLTRRCNLKCIGCRYHSSQVDAPRHPVIIQSRISRWIFSGNCAMKGSVKLYGF